VRIQGAYSGCVFRVRIQRIRSWFHATLIGHETVVFHPPMRRFLVGLSRRRQDGLTTSKITHPSIRNIIMRDLAPTSKEDQEADFGLGGANFRTSAIAKGTFDLHHFCACPNLTPLQTTIVLTSLSMLATLIYWRVFCMQEPKRAVYRQHHRMILMPNTPLIITRVPQFLH
jgi:hypothetical protein